MHNISPDVPSGTFQGAGGVGGLLAIKDWKTNKTYAVLNDGRGNVTGLVDASSGEQVAKYAYGPFGESVMAVGEAREVCPFRFSTKYFDKTTGLHYYGYRYYSASTGRWLNRDPIGEEGGVNLYGFVGNDPVNKWDLWGLKIFDLSVDHCGCETLDEALEAAYNARAAYGINSPAEGWDEADYKSLGLDASMFKWGGFSAKLFFNKQTGKYMMSYAGTNDAHHDIITDVFNFLSYDFGGQYSRATALANKVRDAIGNASIIHTGHSLGGGLAVMGRSRSPSNRDRAITFNSAAPGVLTASEFSVRDSTNVLNLYI